MAEVAVKKISSAQLKAFLGGTEEKACTLATALNKAFAIYSINSFLRICHSLAQMAHESNAFSRYVENLNYSAQSLANTWPTRFAVNPKAKIKVPNDKANEIARKPELIAAAAYNGRNGNTLPGDGWTFRGSGCIQLTGKENVSAYAAFKGLSNAYDTVRLLRENDEYAIDSACWYLAVRVKCLDEMDRDDIVAVTRAVNGGLIGLDDRKALLAKAKRIFA